MKLDWADCPEIPFPVYPEPPHVVIDDRGMVITLVAPIRALTAVILSPEGVSWESWGLGHYRFTISDIDRGKQFLDYLLEKLAAVAPLPAQTPAYMAVLKALRPMIKGEVTLVADVSGFKHISSVENCIFITEALREFVAEGVLSLTVIDECCPTSKAPKPEPLFTRSSR